MTRPVNWRPAAGVDEIPSIKATDYEEIHDILHSLCLLAGCNRPGGLSFTDIETVLLSSGGEIKVLQTFYNDSSDINDLCDRLIALK